MRSGPNWRLALALAALTSIAAPELAVADDGGTSKGKASQVTTSSPGKDSDRDGIPDSADKCPQAPEDVDGFEDADGCPDPDNDRDGVPDKSDKCPLAPGPADAEGCPKAVRVDLAIGQIVLLQPIEFATNKDTVLEQSAPVLEEVRATLAANPQFVRVRIEGHTDARGSNHKNLDLSARRAESVRAWLVGHGISSSRLLSSGCGALFPIATNKTDEGRQRNWRIELHIVSDDIDIRTGCVDASS